MLYLSGSCCTAHAGTVGTIIERKRKDGSVGYHAQVVVRQDGVTHRETQDLRPPPGAWIKKRERALSLPGAVAGKKAEDPPLSAVIDRDIAESRRAIGRTKAQVLTTIKTCDIAAKPCSTITSADVIAFATELSAGRQPQTVANCLVHLGSVIAIAQPALGLPAQSRLHAGRPEGPGPARPRRQVEDAQPPRPTLDELDRLQTIVASEIVSTRRQEEITRLAWADLDEEGSRVLIRDMKNPGQKVSNDVWCELPPEALRIVQAQPREGERIFPYTPDAISAAFTRACGFLGIEDLVFHDLRHEGVSRLFEMSRTVPLAASVSGHKSWSSLQRYMHIRQAGDRYVGWRGLSKIINAKLYE